MAGTPDASPLDAFLPAFDAREHHALTVRAPAALVYETLRGFDMQSPPLVRAIFRLRDGLMRSAPVRRKPRGFIDEILSLGWGPLAERPGAVFVAGAACQPWVANVVFRAIPSDRFRDFS